MELVRDEEKKAEGPRELHTGDTGEDVKRLQSALAAWGFSPGNEDGYGDNTAASVSALQRKLGITPTGGFDGATRKAVTADLKSDTSVLRRAMIRLVPDIPSSPSNPSSKSIVPASTASTPTTVSSVMQSPLVWLLAGGVAIYLLARGSKPKDNVEIEGIELETGEDDDSSSEEEEKPKKKRRKRAAKRKMKSLADPNVIDVEPTKVEVVEKPEVSEEETANAG